jgi:hypothetical protein
MRGGCHGDAHIERGAFDTDGARPGCVPRPSERFPGRFHALCGAPPEWEQSDAREVSSDAAPSRRRGRPGCNPDAAVLDPACRRQVGWPLREATTGLRRAG